MTLLAADSNGHKIQAISPGTTQVVAVAATHAEIATAVDGNTTIIRIVSKTNCFYAIGAAPVAAADGTCPYLPANVVEFVAISHGQKVSFVRDTADGNAYVTEAK